MDPKNEEKILTLLTQVLAENNKLMAQLAKQPSVADDDYEAQHRAVSEKMKPSGPDQIVYRNIQTNSGAFWDFVVSPQDKKVFDLAFIRLPDGAYSHQKDGGLVPDGLPIFNVPQVHRPQIDKDGNDQSIAPDSNELTMQFRQYVRESYSLPDRRQYVGKPMPEHLKPKQAGTTKAA